MRNNEIIWLLESGRLLRGGWTARDMAGDEHLCLLAALSPDVARAQRPNACPRSIMPPWFAHLTPWLSDQGSVAVWYRMVRRYAALRDRWHVLPPAVWQRLDWTARRLAVESMLSDLPEVHEAVGLLHRAEDGHPPNRNKRKAARQAALEVSAFAASEALSWRIDAATRAASAAVWDQRRRRGETAQARTQLTAMIKAHDARLAADRLTTAILDSIEQAIEHEEQAKCQMTTTAA